MRRQVLVSGAGLALAVQVLAGGVAPAQAAAPTCLGLAATVVGPGPDDEVSGTAGDDVIVSNGAFVVDALGGNDRVCLTGTNSAVSVDAGEGDDQVVSSTRADADVTLGPGDDVFSGGSGSDSVDGEAGASLGTDRISTGAGSDRVHTGAAGDVNRDIVELGAGDDVVQSLTRPGDQLTVRGGPGTNGLWVLGDAAGPGAWVADAAAGTLSLDASVVATWRGMSGFIFISTHGDVTFDGSDGADEVALLDIDHAPVVTTGAGDDSVSFLTRSTATDDGGLIRTGPGRDLVSASLFDDARVDLAAGRARLDGLTLGIAGVEDVNLVADRARLRGDARGNTLFAAACDARLQGGRGSDRLRTVFPGEGQLACDAPFPVHVLQGGRGADRLSGWAYEDRLLGGPGRDVADGRGGRDLCRAEVERRCER